MASDKSPEQDKYPGGDALQEVGGKSAHNVASSSAGSSEARSNINKGVDMRPVALPGLKTVSTWGLGRESWSSEQPDKGQPSEDGT